MNIKDVKENIANMKQPEFTEKNRNINDFPSAPGYYSIGIDDLDFMNEEFLKFDGEKWENLDEYISLAKGDLTKISYYDENPNPVKAPVLPKKI